MGLFDKVMFWKKNDDLALNTNLGLDVGQGFGQNPSPGVQQQNFNPSPFSQQQFSQLGMQQPFPEQQQWNPPQPPREPAFDPYQNRGGYGQDKQLELISAKLDALKAAMDSMSQRLANVERMIDNQDFMRKKGW